MSVTIEYESSNGYRGVLYGKSSLIIWDPNGNTSMHTGSRNIETYDELVKVVDEWPETLKLLQEVIRYDSKRDT